MIPEFESSFTTALPADAARENQRRQVEGACYSYVAPTPVAAPNLIAWTPDLARTLQLPEDLESAAPLTALFAGNEAPRGSTPWAACYGGHQFGSWAGQLGDGRAISLGELRDRDGRSWELQLKGAGPTPYSRRGDGRAVLRSSIREYLCSEAMHHLGVPTTRALSLVTTGDAVRRDMFYDGNAQDEPGAIVCRVAPSFLRFGSFEIFAARRDTDTAQKLLAYMADSLFAHIDGTGDQRIGRIFEEICRSTALMIAHWMRVGFVHGVMNTDNMSVLGLTIDYGPYGWLDDYDPNWTPNTTDAQGRRYRFGHQPAVAGWNLERLAHAFAPLCDDPGVLAAGLEAYPQAYEAHMLEMYAAKLGIAAFNRDSDPENPHEPLWLLGEAQRILVATPTDMTLFYRALSTLPPDENASDEALLRPIEDAWYHPDSIDTAHRERTLTWLRALTHAWRHESTPAKTRTARMNAANPKYVLRNYLAQLAIDASESGDHNTLNQLYDCIQTPYDDQPQHNDFAAKRPQWAENRPGCSMLSCSS